MIPIRNKKSFLFSALIFFYFIEIVRSSPRINGGQEATPHEFSSMIQISDIPQGIKCGGTLLNDQWVLTAAHCFCNDTRKKPDTVGRKEIHETTWLAFAGVHDMRNNQTTTVQIRKIPTKEGVGVFCHPYYSIFTFINDIALIKVEEKFELNQFVAPVKLPSPDFRVQGNSTMAGWGLVSLEENPNYKPSPVLKKLELSIFEDEYCHNAYLNELYPPNIVISEPHLCAETWDGSGSACSGDSGGPLYDLSGSEQVVVGVVSAGRFVGGICRRVNFPSVYTEVAYYVDWIERTIKENP